MRKRIRPLTLNVGVAWELHHGSVGEKAMQFEGACTEALCKMAAAESYPLILDGLLATSSDSWQL